MMGRALLPLFIAPIFVLLVSFVVSGRSAFADSPTFTPPPTLTPLPSSTPGSPTSSPVSTPVPTYAVGLFHHWWETGTAGDSCGLTFFTYPPSLFTLTIPSSGMATFVSGGFDFCTPRRWEQYADVYSRWGISSTGDISVSSDIWVTITAEGEPSSVEFLVEGSCGSGDCIYYRDYLGPGIHHFMFNVEAADRTWDHSMVIRCRGWYWDDPGRISCLFRQVVTVCGPDGCGSPEPPEPPPQDCCTGPGECELRPGQFLRIRGAAPVSPVYDVQLQQLGVVITGDLPGSYIVLGASPRTGMLLISSQPLTYLLGSSSCTFPACGGSSFCSIFSSGGVVPASADCVGPDPVLSVIGVPVSGVTSWMCPITAFCSRDFPPYDLGQGASSAAGECAHPGFPDGYWVPVSGTVAAASNAFDIDEYWLFIDYSDLFPSLPISSPTPIEYRDGNETCFDIPPFGDELNSVLTRLFSRSIDVLTVCIFPRYFKLRNFPGSDVVFDGLVSLFVLASALLIIRALHRLGRA